jgi:hypothetical protein
MDTARTQTDDRHLCTAMPPAIASSQFEYDAGPVPAVYMLQVFRCSSDSHYAPGYGVLNILQYNEKVTLRAQYQYRLVFCGPSVDPVLGIEASKTGDEARWINHSSRNANVIPAFMEEPPHVGALALLHRLNRQDLTGKQARLLSWNESAASGRWAVQVERSVIAGPIENPISILVTPANLFVFAAHEPAGQVAPSRLPLVAFYAARRIELELLWNYLNDQKSRGIDGLA